MATRKSKKKSTKLKKAAKKPQVKKPKKKLASKKPAPKKKLAGKRTPKKAAAKAKPAIRKTNVAKPVTVVTKRSSRRSRRSGADEFAVRMPGSGSAGQSGDLQGLSNAERADSESVDELIEEGNAFEADAVAGVESADNSDEQEVHTHEVPEDDVPSEYLDEK